MSTEQMVPVIIDGKQVGEISLAKEYRILLSTMLLGAKADIAYVEDRLKELDEKYGI